MNIHLKNIGIIKDSNIQLDGLTVITGKNSSGKTTVGKVLYSLIESTTDIERKASDDKKKYIMKIIREVRNVLDVFRFLYRRLPSEEETVDDRSAMGTLFNRISYHISLYSLADEEYIHLLYEELKAYDIASVIESGKLDETYAKMVSRTGDVVDVSTLLRERIQKACEILENLFEELASDTELINYTRESISQTLRCEFSKQIQPISNPDAPSSIELYEKETLYFKSELFNNRIVNTGQPVYISSPFSRVVFLDDPFILDRARGGVFSSEDSEDVETMLDTTRIKTHDMVLARILRSEKNTTVFEDTLLEKELFEIKNQINETIPGTFEFGDEGEFYVQNGKKLKFSNLATGSKIFSFIKILLEKGMIDKNTLLLLDEPEAHLHPDWQNCFVEVIVMLVARLGVNVLLTTHSSNFMLAVDAYMRKHKINSKCNFYQTKYLEDGFVDYKCVNDNMGEIYADFMESLSRVKMLRNEYITE